MCTSRAGAADREMLPDANAVVMQESAVLQDHRQQCGPHSSPDCSHCIYTMLQLAQSYKYNESRKMWRGR